MNPTIAQDLAREHASGLHESARRRRLAAIAACCRPSYLARRLAGLRRPRPAAATCCA